MSLDFDTGVCLGIDSGGPELGGATILSAACANEAGQVPSEAAHNGHICELRSFCEEA
jgi:hypothetical protein